MSSCLSMNIQYRVRRMEEQEEEGDVSSDIAWAEATTRHTYDRALRKPCDAMPGEGLY